jgi:uncharacterized protein with HEPN domain
MRRDGPTALRDDRERLKHMLAAARDVVFFATERTRPDLENDRMFMRAVLHAIQEIGEAAARVSDAGRSRAAQLPWGSIVQMRHILVHMYDKVNLDYVWEVVARDLQPLIAAIESALGNWHDDEE